MNLEVGDKVLILEGVFNGDQGIISDKITGDNKVMAVTVKVSAGTFVSLSVDEVEKLVEV
ncbi:hypothetical protein [Liquorilactobacillus mali]|uniref:KOW domain-containing protein n=1 Tax=Liquorilactobacillus mali KCTC 3596 = DSM 20444 TaxID=1046596 RepID=A0A0R2EAK8_9LACO|nr:hypothetical protein [Liquorilactobacillus mali]KRN09388.1 hypothetical protein FD00_GL001111 [Liquorilactobacillus mali KCTC 3596 = DSM 20444]